MGDSWISGGESVVIRRDDDFGVRVKLADDPRHGFQVAGSTNGRSDSAFPVVPIFSLGAALLRDLRLGGLGGGIDGFWADFARGGGFHA